MASRDKIHKTSRNIFYDLNVARPEQLLARACVMLRIAEIIRERGITQKEAAALLGVPQSKISRLMNGKLSQFSMDRLFDMLNILGRNVEIIIKPKPRREKTASTHVVMI